MHHLILLILFDKSTIYALEPEETYDYVDLQVYNVNDAQKLFGDFVKQYKKHYKNESERLDRYKIFVDNIEYLNRINLEAGKTVYQVNQFADLEDFHNFDKLTDESWDPLSTFTIYLYTFFLLRHNIYL